MPCEADGNYHNLTHLPFRSWCPYCVQGKAVSHPHVKRKAEEADVPVISSDYMGLKHREPEEGQNPIIVTVDRKTKTKFAHVLKAKGVDHYAVEICARDLTTGLGYNKFVLKDDQEPAIKSLREAVIRRVGAIKGEVQVIPEESPVGESQSNGKSNQQSSKCKDKFVRYDCTCKHVILLCCPTITTLLLGWYHTQHNVSTVI